MSTISDDSDDSDYGMELYKYSKGMDSARRDSIKKTMLDSHILNSIEYSKAENCEHMEDSWSRYMDEESGYAYFHNSGTGESKWEEDNAYHSSSDNTLAIGVDKHHKTNGWVEVNDENGNTYYYNKVRFITVQYEKVLLFTTSISNLRSEHDLKGERKNIRAKERYSHIKIHFLSSFIFYNFSR